MFCADRLPRQQRRPTTGVNVDLALCDFGHANTPLRALTKADSGRYISEASARGLEPSTVRARYSAVRRVIRGAVAEDVVPTDPHVAGQEPCTRSAENDHSLSGGRPRPASRRRSRPPRGHRAGRVGRPAGWGSPGATPAGPGLAAAHGARAPASHQPGGCDPAQVGELTPGHPLPEDLLADLAEHVTAGGAWGYLVGGGYEPLPRARFHWAWTKTVERAGLSGVRFHDLRHHAASMWLAEGLDVVTASKILVHSAPTMTLGVDAHVISDAKDRARAVTSRVFAAVMVA